MPILKPNSNKAFSFTVMLLTYENIYVHKKTFQLATYFFIKNIAEQLASKASPLASTWRQVLHGPPRAGALAHVPSSHPRHRTGTITDGRPMGTLWVGLKGFPELDWWRQPHGPHPGQRVFSHIFNQLDGGNPSYGGARRQIPSQSWMWLGKPSIHVNSMSTQVKNNRSKGTCNN